ncbi:TonB-dependent receptor [Phenylobacterium sp. LjRoot225]|uniref:TonB-dependent receptor n=1 Tax=Phenylobacterium sp. LjRoot225 TaxID=3342285 RepID=UPI003ECE9780
MGSISASATPRRRRLAALLLASSAICACGSPALAAAADEAQTVEEVVVTGMKKSLQSAVEMKQQTMEIVDSIRAEDIGKLPDSNVAETLTRIPGVQGYRYGGEGASPVGSGSGLTIRGLSGQTASQVDGRAYFTAGSREFNIESAIPGMVAGLDVYKNPSAEHIEGGIGGLVNVRTRRPFDFKGLAGSAAVTARYNDLAKSTQPDYFGLISNRWKVGDGEMGLLLAFNQQRSFNRSDNSPGPGGTQLRRPIRADSAEYAANTSLNRAYVGRSDVTYLADVDPLTLSAADRQNLVTLAGVTTNVFQEDIRRVRKGFNGAFQWKPSSNLELYVDSTYSYYLYHQNYRFLTTADSRYAQNLKTVPFSLTEGLANRNLNGGEDAVLAGQKFASGTFLGSGVSSIGGDEHRPYTTWVLGTGAKWTPTDRLSVDFDVSYVAAKQTQDNRAVTMAPRNGLAWDITRAIGVPQSLAISGPDLASPATWVFRNYDNGTHLVYHDQGLAGRVDVKYDLDSGFIQDIKVGARVSSTKSKFSNFSYGGRPLTTDGQALNAAQSNAIFATGAADLVGQSPTNWFDGQAGYSGGYLVFTPDMLLDDNVRNRFPLAGIPADSSIPENLLAQRVQQEKTYAAYAVADFALLDDKVRGSAGVRFVRTELTTQGRVLDTTGAVPAIVGSSADTSYTNVLPTFNVAYYFTPDTLLRFGYGKGLTRPSSGDLTPSITVNSFTGLGNGGNPNLKPFTADSFDLSFEKYFSSNGYASAALFYKKIDGFVLGADTCLTVPNAPAYTGTISNNCPAGQYRITTSVNAEKGSAKGVELAAQTFFDFLPGQFKNFGVQGSFSYVKTELPVMLSGRRVVTRQPFQSNISWNVAGLYENDLVSARLVYTYRSDFVLFGTSANPIDGRYIKGYGLLDASVNFNLNKSLTLSLNASNLLNKAPNRYVGEPDNGYDSGILRQGYLNGRIYSVGLRYRFGG